MYRLGRLAAGPVGGFVAAGLLLTRFNFGLLASKGYLDVPYCAFVAWAMALEAERPKRGGAVWWLLGLAGLLRPEAWLLAGLYGLWLGSGGVRNRVRVALPALAAPGLWMALDFAVTGNPLFSIQHTDALAAELQREVPLGEIPQMTGSLLIEVLKLPVLLLAVVGVLLALRGRVRPLAVPAVVALVTLGTYLIIATGGLAGVYRYLLLTGVGGILFAAFALAGWARLPRRVAAARGVDGHGGVRRARRRGLHRHSAERVGPGAAAGRAAGGPGGAERAARAPRRRRGGAVRDDHGAQPQAAARDPLGARPARGRRARPVGPHAGRHRPGPRDRGPPAVGRDGHAQRLRGAGGRDGDRRRSGRPRVARADPPLRGLGALLMGHAAAPPARRGADVRDRGLLALPGGPPPSRVDLAAMSEALAHRGPDGSGFHLDATVGLAIRRLALVDPVGGQQPIASEDGNVRVVANGELYDHRALRRGLERRGHTFRTGSDIEVLVHLYEERGPAFVEGLRGMFAVALWDARRRTLVLARDPYGIKPLVYARLGAPARVRVGAEGAARAAGVPA